MTWNSRPSIDRATSTARPNEQSFEELLQRSLRADERITLDADREQLERTRSVVASLSDDPTVSGELACEADRLVAELERTLESLHVGEPSTVSFDPVDVTIMAYAHLRAGTVVDRPQREADRSRERGGELLARVYGTIVASDTER